MAEMTELGRAASEWEADHQRTALEALGLAEEFPFGCDAIDAVAEALLTARAEITALGAWQCVRCGCRFNAMPDPVQIEGVTYCGSCATVIAQGKEIARLQARLARLAAAQRVVDAAIPAMVLLASLRLSVQWELAPSIMDEIKQVEPALRGALAEYDRASKEKP